MNTQTRKAAAKKSFPVVPLRDIIIYPQMVAPLLIGKNIAINAVESAMESFENEIVLIAQKEPALESPEVENLYSFGVLAHVIQILKFPDGTIKAIVEAVSRVKIKTIELNDNIYYAQISKAREKKPAEENIKALLRLTLNKFESYVKKNTKMTPENLLALSAITNDPGRISDIIATYLDIPLSEKQHILELTDEAKRLEYATQLLEKEIELLDIELDINRKLKFNLDKTQKEIVLREKLKVINQELYGTEDSTNEFDDIIDKINALPLEDKYIIKLKKEAKRISSLPSYSSEVGVLKAYLDRVIELPWNNISEDHNDIINARKILDEDHWGLEDVKERIIEFLAVKQLSGKKQAAILCLVGPPGVGKTSLAKSVARSMNRQYSYISLGGINDESEIRGHRKTYVGSMPGKIIQAIETAGTKNPVIVLDEIEKMQRSHMGDPTAAMLEVLDPVQNINFTDHYIGIPFDLSSVFFIATANTTDTIYKALRDRLEIIKLSGYTDEEKLNIAINFLIPKQLDLHGIKKSRLSFTRKALQEIINGYTREAGVRNLERSIAKICRKVATEIIREEIKKVSISLNNLTHYLGVPKYSPNDKRTRPEIGIINGLAYTEFGGELLNIETNMMPGKGELKLTGSLGNVMQESANIAYSFIKSNSAKYSIKEDLQKKFDIHIHVPDGATPKDGPSAGLAITLAMISTFTKKPLRSDIALTGEVTLRGNILPIGGVKEKVLAALRNEIFTVIIPEKNKKDVSELPEYINSRMNYIFVNSIDQAFEHIFITNNI